MKKSETLKLKKVTIASLDKNSLSKVLGGQGGGKPLKPYENSSGITLCSANPMGCGGYSGC